MTDRDPDEQLVRRLGQGDESAARLLVGAKLPRLLGFAARLLRDRFEAEDVVQETFVRAWRHARAWEPGQARFDTWLHTVVLNLCRDRMRRRRDMADPTTLTLIDPAPDAEASMLAMERAKAVAAAIASLPERQREAILLVHYQDCRGNEAALAMGITIEALEALLARARRRLRDRLAEPQCMTTGETDTNV